jgi:hypothetical protein
MKKTNMIKKASVLGMFLLVLSSVSLPVFSTHAQEAASSEVAADPIFVLSMRIESPSDLSAYTSAVLEQDPDARDLSVSEGSVHLGYKQQVRLFGLIPMSVSATATVRADGAIDLTYPWYAFFSTKNNARVRSNLELFAGRIAESEGLSELGTQARVAEALRIVMKDNLEGRDTSAEAERP